jgi:amino acid permease
LMLIGVGYITWYGVHLIVKMTAEADEISYQSAVLRTCGETGENVYLVAVILSGMGALMSYITIIGGTTSSLLQSWGCGGDGCGVYSVTGIVVPIFVLPPCLFRHYGHLSGLSAFSFTTICLCVIFVVIAGPIVADNSGEIAVLTPIGLITKMGSVVFALAYAASAFMGYRSLKDRTVDLYDQVSMGAVGTGAFMCVLIAVAGYGAFRDDTDGEILDNFTTHAADPFKILLVIHLILYIPVDAVVLRDAVVKLFISKDVNTELTFPAHFAMTTCIIGTCTMIVMLLRAAGLTKGEAFSAILDITGSLAGSALSFSFPALLFLRTVHPTWPYEGFMQNGTRKATALLCFGICVMIIVPIVTLTHSEHT